MRTKKKTEVKTKVRTRIAKMKIREMGTESRKEIPPLNLLGPLPGSFVF